MMNAIDRINELKTARKKLIDSVTENMDMFDIMLGNYPEDVQAEISGLNTTIAALEREFPYELYCYPAATKETVGRYRSEAEAVSIAEQIDVNEYAVVKNTITGDIIISRR